MLEFLPDEHPIQRIEREVLAQLREAQENLLDRRFPTAADLCERACQQVGVEARLAGRFRGIPLFPFADSARSTLVTELTQAARDLGLPPETVPEVVGVVADRVQLLRAFERPDEVIDMVATKVQGVVRTFPRSVADIEQGKNPGDLLDPFIVAATQELLYSGDMEGTVEGVTVHKAMMMIEDLAGHLHEDVIGRMRGNVRAPEPRGEDQETLDPILNPFPGADVVQPPWRLEIPLRFHQVKSKTGSAKGGDAARLGQQLRRLHESYQGEIYYDALIGRSLRGHRSMAGVLRVAPNAIVLVGRAAFQALTGTPNGAELLLRLYQAAFRRVAVVAGYSLEQVVAGIATEFRERARERGEDYLRVLLEEVTSGDAREQDSRTYERRGRVGRGRRRRGGRGR